MLKVIPTCLLLLVLIISCRQPAKPRSPKTQPAIAGVYDTRNGDPESAGALYVLPGHQFLLGYFGGAVTGTWEIKDTIVVFKPQVKPAGFHVYGRHNEKLSHGIRVFFGGVASGGSAAIGFNPATNNVKRIFADGPLSPDFPYISVFASIPKGMRLAAHLVDETGKATAPTAWQIYTYYNNDQYNDFVVAYTPVSTHPKSLNFYGTIKNGRLDFPQKASAKKPFDRHEKQFVKQMLSIPANPDEVFYSPDYMQPEPGFEKDTLNYRFNKQKNAYIKLHGYVEGEENKSPKKDGSNSLHVLYKYQKLKAGVTFGQVNLDTTPIF
jgi:hypothetical protein